MKPQLKKKFPAKYFILRMVLGNGDVIDFKDAPWDVQFIPRSERLAQLVVCATDNAWDDRGDLDQILPRFKRARIVTLIEYSIVAFAGSRMFRENFQHEFRQAAADPVTELHKSWIVSTEELFEARDLNELFKTKAFPGQQAIQFIS